MASKKSLKQSSDQAPENVKAKQVALIRGRQTALLTALDALASHLHISERENWAAKQQRRITRAIVRKRHEKLTTWHIKNVVVAPTSEKGTVAKATVQAVFFQSELVKARGRFIDPDNLIRRAKHVTFDELRPDERRAAQLLSGAKKKPKKNVIEESAEKLASPIQETVRKSRRGSVGRPDGSVSNKVRIKGLQYDVPLSAIDICAAVLPIIEEVTKSQIKPAGWNIEAPKDADLAFEVVVAAVNTEVSNLKRTSIARAIYRLKAASN
jgi:hypothetical protein